MLKLTMNSRKRSKRLKAYPRGRKTRESSRMEICDMETSSDDVKRDMLADNLRSMMQQERGGNYACVDYLAINPWQQQVYQVLKKNQMERFPQKDLAPETRIDEYCREQIAEWSFRVVDYFRIDREVVAVSISFLDRFLATCRCDRTSFKLAATATLHLAVKLLYPCKLGDLGILSDLSRGEFDMTDVAHMESHILRSLSWQLHPPTPAAFASILLDFVFSDANKKISVADLDDIYDVSSFFCDLAVCDYFFVPLHSSSIAIAAILNSLEGIFGPENGWRCEIVKASRELGLCADPDLSASRNRLWELYERSEECALHNNKVTAAEEQSAIFVKKLSTQSSPVSISTSCASGPEITCPKHAQVIRKTSW